MSRVFGDSGIFIGRGGKEYKLGRWMAEEVVDDKNGLKRCYFDAFYNGSISPISVLTGKMILKCDKGDIESDVVDCGSECNNPAHLRFKSLNKVTRDWEDD